MIKRLSAATTTTIPTISAIAADYTAVRGGIASGCYVVLFVIDLESRRVHIAGLVREPHDAWIQQVARNLIDDVDGF
jgi:hypothetical protein